MPRPWVTVGDGGGHMLRVRCMASVSHTLCVALTTTLGGRITVTGLEQRKLRFRQAKSLTPRSHCDRGAEL